MVWFLLLFMHHQYSNNCAVRKLVLFRLSAFVLERRLCLLHHLIHWLQGLGWCGSCWLVWFPFSSDCCSTGLMTFFVLIDRHFRLDCSNVCWLDFLSRFFFGTRSSRFFFVELSPFSEISIFSIDWVSLTLHFQELSLASAGLRYDDATNFEMNSDSFILSILQTIWTGLPRLWHLETWVWAVRLIFGRNWVMVSIFASDCVDVDRAVLPSSSVSFTLAVDSKFPPNFFNLAKRWRSSEL